MRKVIPSIMVLILAVVLKSNAEDLDVSESTGEQIAVYFPYNYRQHSNKIEWIDDAYNKEGKRHSLQMVGMGVKYFPTAKIFFDLLHKNLITLPKISEMTSVFGGNISDSSLGKLDSYVLTMNYRLGFMNNFKFYAGAGMGLNNIEFIPSGKINVGPTFDMQFFTWILNIGTEYKITKRCSLFLSLGFEKNVKLIREFGFAGYNILYQYDYKSPFFIEPAIMFYF